MTCIRSCLTVDVGYEKRSVQKRRKAVLTCPRCTHASPLDGDWIWTSRDHGTEVRCPTCYELLTVRDQFDESPAGEGAK